MSAEAILPWGKPEPVPTHVRCACCGKAIGPLDGYGISPPVGSDVEPADLCGLTCLRDWCIGELAAGDPIESAKRAFGRKGERG